MAMAGARGPTRQEFAQVLHLDLPEESLSLRSALSTVARRHRGLQLRLLAVGPDQDAIRAAVRRPPRQDYDAPLRLVDFGDYPAAAEDINRWMAEATNGRIKQAVDPEGPRPT